MPDLSSLDLGEIATALADQTDYEHWWLINPQTGEIAFWTSDTGIDGQTPVALDELERASRRLAQAIQGKGAFRRFKAQLHEEHPHMLPAWYAFRDARAFRRAVERLADNSLVHDDAATRFLGEHPETTVP